MNKKALSLVMAGVLSACAVIPAFAGGTNGGAVPSANGTEIYAGVMLHDPDAKIKVEVPTLFAFVVNGSVSAADTDGVTSTNGGILLPNVKVKVNQVSGELPNPADPPKANYSIQTVGDGVMQLTNYSTMADQNAGAGDSGRIGLEVKVNGNVKNEGDAASRNYWEHVSGLLGTEATPLAGEFKKYNISIDNKSLSTAANGGLELAPADIITIGAPINIVNSLNLDTNTNLAQAGVTKTVAFDVAVGGMKNQYKQVEESAKVGTIVWTVSAEVEESVYTAPDNDHLDGEGEAGFTPGGTVNDPDDIELQ